MNMICHQAVGQNIYIVALAIRMHPFKIGQPVIATEKNILTPVASLGNMMGHA